VRLLPDFLWHGAEAYGFRGEVWICNRVARAIEEEFGVRYHKGQVSRPLKALGLTPQIPITRAIQLDEGAMDVGSEPCGRRYGGRLDRSGEPWRS
jgi:transposase